MDDRELTTEDLEKIRELREKQEQDKIYTPRPKSHRMLAWVLIGLMVLGIALFCYWQMTPLA